MERVSVVETVLADLLLRESCVALPEVFLYRRIKSFRVYFVFITQLAGSLPLAQALGSQPEDGNSVPRPTLEEVIERSLRPTNQFPCSDKPFNYHQPHFSPARSTFD